MNGPQGHFQPLGSPSRNRQSKPNNIKKKQSPPAKDRTEREIIIPAARIRDVSARTGAERFAHKFGNFNLSFLKS